ncbi:Hydroxymethylbilane synthase [Aquirufa nivalisilvae]|uniref:Hydroxymethylbilane synthase n=1 Tax=Aquirufa nivalisilvae TaxID=2516557 RepID=A0A2S2DWZ7_9BACT|nr:hydroxymethylbilane synthase [Aquirufa nivalisilvae]AWL09886.1 Hydroxymethylbilane synthase [Aquirufa nivalisilvae]
MQHIRIGTRNSALALWQANHIGHLLEMAGFSYELMAISTKGDQVLDRSLSKIGSKGVFTEELETMLREGEIDIAQHSAKDLPSHLPEDLELIAYTEREAAHDVVLSLDPSLRLDTDKKLKIGTSSTRRRAFLKHFYPQHEAVEMRGNLQTRLEKLKQGTCDAMLLAYAGVHRMDMSAYITQHLEIAQFVPAVGQGSVAIQCAVTLDPSLKEQIRAACNHIETEKCLLAERSLLYQLEGGCSVPVYGHAILKEDSLQLTGGVLSLNGQQKIEFTQIGTHPEILGKHLAGDLVNSGARKILQAIRAELNP